MRFNFLYITLVLGLLLGLVSCQDDRLYDDSVIPEGETLVSATLNFESFTPALESRAAGDAIKAIKTLSILIYDTEGNLLETHTKDELTDYKEETNTNYPEDWPDKNGVDNPGYPEQGVEGSTPRATFKFKLPMGRYYIYAVANYDLTGKDVSTVEKLKNIKLTWDKTAIANNSEMFGYFTLTNTVGADKFQPDAPITLNKSVSTIHSWIKRAASKITIAYDAKNMKNGVFVYLKNATIKDIPASCFLGADNTPSSADDLIAEGESFKYYKGDTPPAYDEKYPARLTRGGETSTFGSDHAEKSDALFFYENMQGKGKDKRQDADGNNILDAPGLPGDEKYVLKDDKPYGTYIEVEAYYVQINAGHVSRGDIKYRFMLGKDVTTDYNAERNHHYKLTLKFNGNANDVDWHIEYKEDKPGIELPERFYISYLYNHSTMLPVKINTGGRKVDWMRADIIENNWKPDGAPNDGSIYYGGSVKNPVADGTKYKYNGFLSLHKTTDTRLISTDVTNGNKTFYEKAPKRGERIYENFGFDNSYTTEGSESDDKYNVLPENDDPNQINLEIPLYTRAKQMIKATGYTGNNPYVAYQRTARVKVSVKLSGLADPISEEVEIRQVRRIVNPKGVYRDVNTTNPDFKVELKVQEGEESTEFTNLASEGKWKAYVVVGDRGLVTLNGATALSGEEDGAVGGDTGSDIAFNIHFNNTTPAGQSKFAIVRVEYHNYSCYHLIFIRQGDAPTALLSGGAKWHAKNLRTATAEAESPLDEGSLFKWGNLDEPIDAESNQSDLNYGKIPAPGDFKAPGNLTLVDGTSKAWSEITSEKDYKIATFNYQGPGRIADLDDYAQLYQNESIEQGYGVLYGDGATGTATNIDVAYGYGYYRADKASCGMRGCFVYNKSETGEYSGVNVFFPIGASGYGNRKSSESGMLRYSSARVNYYPEHATFARSVECRPLFYDLYRRPGGVYWINTPVLVTQEQSSTEGNLYYSFDADTEATKGKNYTNGWDFNYFTFDFFPITYANVFTGGWLADLMNDSNALFIRCVD
ncbi:hypothetical protein [uncultured Muribaculum sp.]|uniref:hypothetical protein n=1 Tax=uncultured Muribaculum sp. TaxID=1918613 RepID=UPI0025B13CA1|nr:hypothetical protein [uncultured Muribaculum sp.]